MYVGAGNTTANLQPRCGLYGMGLFDAGLDYSQWQWPEWLAVGVGVFALFSMTSTTKRGYRAVRRKAKAAARA